MTAETTTTVKTFKVRKISKNTEADYPTQRIEAETLLSAGQQYCKINDFGKAIDFLHSSDDVYTLLSSNKSANVIGKFQIYEI